MPFSEDDANRLDESSLWISLALEGARVSELLACEQIRLRALFSVNSALASMLDRYTLLAEISRPIRFLAHHEYSHLAFSQPESNSMKKMVLDSENKRILALCDDFVPVAESPAAVALRAGKP
jgi:hypothetical protein